MEFDSGFWMQVLVYAVSFGIFYGNVMVRLKALERKMDQHNNVIARTYKLEESCKSAHHRSDELRGELERG